MASTQKLSEKLQLKADQKIRVVNCPRGLALGLSQDNKADAVLLFAASVNDLNRLAPPVIAKLGDDELFWIAYPKKTSAIKTDIDRDHGWDAVTKAGWQGVRLVAIDDTWSAMRFRKKP